MKDLVIEAIQNKNRLELYYNGYYRVIEPHTFGISTRGNIEISAFQIDGESESGRINSWKRFTLSEIRDLKMLTDTFDNSRKGYKKGDSRMIEIFKEL